MRPRPGDPIRTTWRGLQVRGRIVLDTGEGYYTALWDPPGGFLTVPHEFARPDDAQAVEDLLGSLRKEGTE